LQWILQCLDFHSDKEKRPFPHNIPALCAVVYGIFSFFYVIYFPLYILLSVKMDFRKTPYGRGKEGMELFYLTGKILCCSKNADDKIARILRLV